MKADHEAKPATDRAKTPPEEKKPWWENLSGLAGALLAVGGVAGGIYQLVLPRHAVTVSIVDGSWTIGDKKANDEEAAHPHERWVLTDSNSYNWKDLKDAEPRYFYAFDLELRNTGNRAVTMNEFEKKPIYVIANVPRRPGYSPPSIEILAQKTTAGNVKAESMLNNLLQVTIRKLPLFGRATIHVTLLSPIEDLGGVNLVSDDPLITVDPPPRSSSGNGFSEIILFNNLLPAKPAAGTP